MEWIAMSPKDKRQWAFNLLLHRFGGNPYDPAELMSEADRLIQWIDTGTTAVPQHAIPVSTLTGDSLQ
jgi:hypothetical protein